MPQRVGAEIYLSNRTENSVTEGKGGETNYSNGGQPAQLDLQKNQEVSCTTYLGGAEEEQLYIT